MDREGRKREAEGGRWGGEMGAGKGVWEAGGMARDAGKPGRECEGTGGRWG